VVAVQHAGGTVAVGGLRIENGDGRADSIVFVSDSSWPVGSNKI
jgi:hypothetical protein